MSVSWKKGYRPDQVLARIDKIKTITDDGRAIFEGFQMRESEVLLYGMLQFSTDVPDRQAFGLLNTALFSVAAKGRLEPRSLLTELNKLQKRFLDQPIQRFALFTSISIKRHTKLPKIWLGRSQIIFDSKPNRRFVQQAEPLINRAKTTLFGNLPNNYLPVRIHISGRSHGDSANRALDQFDFVRGIWNWNLNITQTIRMSFGGKPNPINSLIAGPIHTLHLPDGTLAADETYWYEQNYQGAVKPFNITPHIGHLFKFLAEVRERLEKNKYQETLENAFVRYARALDDRNWDTAYLKLWGLVELLTDTFGDNYDVTIRRAAFVFAERDYYLQVMKYLREYRNRSVHRDIQNPQIEAYLYQLKNIAEGLFRFHVFNNFGFSSIHEAAEFLNLPFEKGALEHREKITQNALRYRGHRK